MNPRSSRGRVVKALDLKSNGRRFEPCRLRNIFFSFSEFIRILFNSIISRREALFELNTYIGKPIHVCVLCLRLNNKEKPCNE